MAFIPKKTDVWNLGKCIKQRKKRRNEKIMEKRKNSRTAREYERLCRKN
jgi:hypothetical protein